MAKVLIVDDEQVIRAMLREFLEDDSHEVMEAENGEQACALYRKSPADLVITDIVMPEKNGIDMIMDLKKDYPDINIVAISGGGGITGRYDYLPIASMVGASNILSKPFSLTEMRKVMSGLLSAC